MIVGVWLCLAGLGPARAESDGEALQRARSAVRDGGYSVALEIFRRLEQSGNIEAARDLGQMYWSGYGVSQDRSKACDYFAQAEAAGDAKATERLALCFDNGDGRPLDYGRSAELFERATTRGVATAYFRLARLEDAGLGRPKNPARAAELCRIGADLGDPVAQASLGQMYLEGNGVTKDIPEGMRWLQKAAQQDLPDANFLLGLRYWDGQGVELDRRHAAEFFFAAATHGSHSAPAYLARYYYLQGFGTPHRLDEQYQIKIVDAPAIASLFWGIIAAGNDPDAEVRSQMIKHVRLIESIVPQLQDPVRAMMAAGRWPPF